MSDDRILHPRRKLLEEIWEELASLRGIELDEYLASIGMTSEGLMQHYANALNAACTAAKRARFEDARRQVRQKVGADLGKLLSFDVAKKKEIMAVIRDYADRTNDMTIAARNHMIDDEGDLDSFLEACMRLGLIDAEGNLKN
ncbi:MAG: hypothetical protein AB7F08_08705 [Dongiaceae bacterium]